MRAEEILPSVRRLHKHQEWLKQLNSGEEPSYMHQVPVSSDERKVLQLLRERGEHKVIVGGFAVQVTEWTYNICDQGYGTDTVTEIKVTPPDPRQSEFSFYHSGAKVIPFRRREP